MTTDYELRHEIAGKYLRGRGFEIGAGLAPISAGAVDEILFIDKCDPSEFAKLFGKPPPYQILSLDEARAGCPEGADFVMAHHVLEHCSNPIKVLETEWLPLLRCGGVLFLSMPSSKIPSEVGRIITPMDHILDDWAFDRGDDAFESIDHITSFIVGWTKAFPDNFPYARGTVQEYTTGILSEINRLGHDLHWHTYSLAAAADLTEVAFHAAGAGIEWLHREETEDCLYLVARKLARAPGTPGPEILTRYRQRLLETHLRLGNDDPGAAASTLELGRDRSAAVKARIPLSSGRGLEISPSATPLVQKSEGNILYCDKFSSASYESRERVPIDLVLGPRLIHEAFPQHSFDYIVSSHVIEHVPDFIQFLKSASLLLRPGGVMVNLVPDRRFTFDVLRENSSIEEIEEAHRQQLRHPCPRMIEDVFLNSDFNAPAIDLWNQTYQPHPTHGDEQARKLISETNPEEADLHCWTFTPQSCRVLLDHVRKRHIPNMGIVEIIETPHASNEFLLHLTFGDHSKTARPGREQTFAEIIKWVRKVLSTRPRHGGRSAQPTYNHTG
jgi:predicted SAM-dependent methyltransferase